MYTKKCARCEQVKDVARFKPLKSATDGLKSWCIDCYIEYKNTHVPNKPKLVATKEGRKVCRRCSQEKVFEDFHKNPKVKDGLDSWCRACKTGYHRGRTAKATNERGEPLRKSKEVLSEGQKRCTSCEDVKPATLEYFRANKTGKNGLESVCRPCYLAGQKAYRERERDKIKQRYRDGRTLKPKEQHATVTRWLIDGKEPTHKTCGGPCGLNKPVSEFQTNGHKINGQPMYRFSCKACVALYYKEHRLKDPEKAKERSRRRCEKVRAERAALRALEPKPKEGHIFCSSCKQEKLHVVDFFEKCYQSKCGLKFSCRVCTTKEKQKHTKQHLSDKYGYQFCKHCDQELVLNEFRTESGGTGRVCKNCKINSEKASKEKMFNNARSRLRTFLFASSERYSDEIGCTNFELKLHIQKQFTPEMNWGNYNTYWNLDHYYPLSKAFQHSSEAYAKARHFANIRPAISKNNFSKHSRVPKEYHKIEVFLKSPVLSKPEDPKKPFSWDD